MGPGRRQVESLGVFTHHAMGIEYGCDTTDRLTHQLQPGQRKFPVRLGVIERDYLILEQLIKTGCFHIILEFGRPVLNLSPNRPSVLTVIAFTPPAIEDTEI